MKGIKTSFENIRQLSDWIKIDPLRKYVLLLTLWSLPIAFHTYFELVIDKWFVIPFLSKFEQTIFAEIIFIALATYLLFILITSKFLVKRYLEWEGIIYITSISSYFYLYKYKWFGFNHWDFLSLKLIPNVMFIDLIIAIPALLLLYKLVGYRIKPVENNKEFTLLEDTHITKGKDDDLGRDHLAGFVANYILNTTSEGSFAIGINAKWGDGKTSFQQMVAEHIKEKDKNAITINFNPWKSIDEKKIIQDFFESYGDAIQIYDLQLGDKILTYGNKLISINVKWWKRLVDLFKAKRKNQEAQFEDINKSLKRVGRKAIVFIDDLDRLSINEILEVVKLVRNSANFYNTFFLVGYDREYLQEALSRHSEYGKDNFLEKIFQIQFDLSHIPPNVIIQKLQSLLIDAVPQYEEQIKSTVGYQPSMNEAFEATFLGNKNPSDFIPSILKNLRDVKRFVNYFSMSFKLVSTEVVFSDYFYISLLKFKYPILIKKILENEK